MELAKCHIGGAFCLLLVHFDEVELLSSPPIFPVLYEQSLTHGVLCAATEQFSSLQSGLCNAAQVLHIILTTICLLALRIQASVLNFE